MSLSDEILKSILTYRESVLTLEYSSKELLSMFEIGASKKPQSSKTKPVSKSTFKVGDFVYNGYRFAKIIGFDKRGYLKVERYYEHDGSHDRFTYNAEDCQLIKPAEDYVREYLNGKDLGILQRKWIDTWLSTRLKPYLHSVDVIGYDDKKRRYQPANGTLEKTLKVGIDYMNNPRAISINYTIPYTCGITVVIGIVLRKKESQFIKVFSTVQPNKYVRCPPFVADGYVSVHEDYNELVFDEDTLRKLIINDEIDVSKLPNFQESLKTKPVVEPRPATQVKEKKPKVKAKQTVDLDKLLGKDGDFDDQKRTKREFVARDITGNLNFFGTSVADLKEAIEIYNKAIKAFEQIPRQDRDEEPFLELYEQKEIWEAGDWDQLDSKHYDLFADKMPTKELQKMVDKYVNKLAIKPKPEETVVTEPIQKAKVTSEQRVITINALKSYPNGTIFVAVNENELEGVIVTKVGSELFIFDEYGGAFSQNVNQNTIDELGGTLRVAHQVSEDDLNEAYFDEDLALEIIGKAK